MPTAIVTGGAIRIGRAMALHLADKGFNIALLYHHSGKAGEETIEEARSYGINCKGYMSDLRVLEETCLLYTSPSPRDVEESRMPSSA